MPALYRTLDGDSRLYVQLHVSRRYQRRAADPVLVRKTGRHLFSGAWYGKNVSDHRSHGKVCERGAVGTVRIGRCQKHLNQIPPLVRRKLT